MVVGFRTGIFGFENMATIVLGVTLLTYLNGVMNINLADAANHVTNFAGATYILTIVAAVLADTYIGRFRAVLISAWIEFLVCIEIRMDQSDYTHIYILH